MKPRHNCRCSRFFELDLPDGLAAAERAVVDRRYGIRHGDVEFDAQGHGKQSGRCGNRQAVDLGRDISVLLSPIFDQLDMVFINVIQVFAVFLDIDSSVDTPAGLFKIRVVSIQVKAGPLEIGDICKGDRDGPLGPSDREALSVSTAFVSISWAQFPSRRIRRQGSKTYGVPAVHFFNRDVWISFSHSFCRFSISC